MAFLVWAMPCTNVQLTLYNQMYSYRVSYGSVSPVTVSVLAGEPAYRLETNGGLPLAETLAYVPQLRVVYIR